MSALEMSRFLQDKIDVSYQLDMKNEESDQLIFLNVIDVNRSFWKENQEFEKHLI